MGEHHDDILLSTIISDLNHPTTEHTLMSANEKWSRRQMLRAAGLTGVGTFSGQPQRCPRGVAQAATPGGGVLQGP